MYIVIIDVIVVVKNKIQVCLFVIQMVKKIDQTTWGLGARGSIHESARLTAARVVSRLALEMKD